MSKQTKLSIVFAHRLWADGSCFSKLIPTLQMEGHDVITAQNILETLAVDVAALTHALGRVSSDGSLLKFPFLRLGRLSSTSHWSLPSSAATWLRCDRLNSTARTSAR
jgi:hypothetical protein